MRSKNQTLGTSHYSLGTVRRGQVLLIAVMLLATIITVVMTVAFNATTETQITRLEIDSQKALAAAEAGIDAVIKQSINSSVNIADIGQYNAENISGNAQVIGVSKSFFVTPLLEKDEQYSLYLSDYPGFGNPWNGSLLLSLVSEANQCPSIEVVIIKNDFSQDRYSYNTCSSTITNAAAISNIPSTLDSIEFSYRLTSPIAISNGTIAFIKVLNGRTKLGFESTDVGNALPLQGKTIESEARTASGVVKKVQLFQSFPQIPSSFFMTSF